MLQAILEQIEDDIEQVSTDVAYDHCHCYDEIENKGANAVIPLRKGAKALLISEMNPFLNRP